MTGKGSISPIAIERFVKHMRQLGHSFLDLCFPRRCAACQKSWLTFNQGQWCDECIATLPWIQAPLCPLCGRPFLKSPTAPDHLCGECLLGMFPFASARSAVLHSGVIRDRIHQLKFGGQLHWVPPLADLMVKTLLRQQRFHIDIIVPVPLHTRRLRQRGFNQSALIAASLGTRLDIPVQFNVLVRKMWTEPQTRLNRQERLRNVRDAFFVPKPMAAAGLSIMLIDDVFTTGTTLSECTKTLKAAGAAQVHALTISRALPSIDARVL